MTDFQFMQKAQPTVALFVSDLHLQAALPRTTAAFLSFLQHQATRTQQLYLLGDIFEYWAGDDDLVTPYNRQIAAALKAVQAQGVQLFWMAGNRDFLVGQALRSGRADAAGRPHGHHPAGRAGAGARRRPVHGRPGLHGLSRPGAQPAYQQQFLAMPLAQRKAIIEGIRKNSQDANQSKEMAIMDVNADAIAALFAQTGSDVLIHGHTTALPCIAWTTVRFTAALRAAGLGIRRRDAARRLDQPQRRRRAAPA
jgi:UDP-2,3-diacylglucosamine hydrolase